MVGVSGDACTHTRQRPIVTPGRSRALRDDGASSRGPGQGRVAAMRLVALLIALFLQPRTPTPAPDTGWLGVQASVVEVALAHDHGGGRLDGGFLTVDPNRRLVLWQGIPGPLGCPDRI